MSGISKETRNARARDNQRLSRARRLEYINSLELRLREFENREMEASRDLQLSARRVERQNGVLRGWVARAMGVFESEVQEWCKSPEEVGEKLFSSHLSAIANHTSTQAQTQTATATAATTATRYSVAGYDHVESIVPPSLPIWTPSRQDLPVWTQPRHHQVPPPHITPTPSTSSDGRSHRSRIATPYTPGHGRTRSVVSGGRDVVGPSTIEHYRSLSQSVLPLTQQQQQQQQTSRSTNPYGSAEFPYDSSMSGFPSHVSSNGFIAQLPSHAFHTHQQQQQQQQQQPHEHQLDYSYGMYPTTDPPPTIPTPLDATISTPSSCYDEPADSNRGPEDLSESIPVSQDVVAQASDSAMTMSHLSHCNPWLFTPTQFPASLFTFTTSPSPNPNPNPNPPMSRSMSILNAVSTHEVARGPPDCSIGLSPLGQQFCSLLSSLSSSSSPFLASTTLDFNLNLNVNVNLDLTNHSTSETLEALEVAESGEEKSSTKEDLRVVTGSASRKGAPRNLTCRQSFDALRHILGTKVSVEEVIGKLLHFSSSSERDGSVVASDAVQEILLRDEERGGAVVRSGTCC